MFSGGPGGLVFEPSHHLQGLKVLLNLLISMIGKINHTFGEADARPKALETYGFALSEDGC